MNMNLSAWCLARGVSSPGTVSKLAACKFRDAPALICLSHLHPAVSEMMHGFGDGKPPFTESVEHVEVRHMSWDA